MVCPPCSWALWCAPPAHGHVGFVQAGQLGELLKQGPGLYSFHEVIEGNGEAVKPEMYFGIGQVR